MQNLGIFMQQMSNCSIIFAFIGNLIASNIPGHGIFYLLVVDGIFAAAEVAGDK